MVCFHWFFRRRKAQPAVEVEQHGQEATAPKVESRTYLADATYLLPKDAQEDQRLNFQHYALYHTFGNHYLAPLSPDVRTILDVGSGTGIWPMDMAKQFPQAHIIGVDLTLTSLPQVLPETCVFCQADIFRWAWSCSNGRGSFLRILCRTSTLIRKFLIMWCVP